MRPSSIGVTPIAGSASRRCRRRRSRRLSVPPRTGLPAPPVEPPPPVEPEPSCRRRPRRGAGTSPHAARPRRGAACRATADSFRESSPESACGSFGSVTVSSRSSRPAGTQRPLSHTGMTRGSGGGDNDSHCAVAHLSTRAAALLARMNGRRSDAGRLLIRVRRSTKGAVCYHTNLTPIERGLSPWKERCSPRISGSPKAPSSCPTARSCCATGTPASCSAGRTDRWARSPTTGGSPWGAVLGTGRRHLRHPGRQRPGQRRPERRRRHPAGERRRLGRAALDRDRRPHAGRPQRPRVRPRRPAVVHRLGHRAGRPLPGRRARAGTAVRAAARAAPASS